MRPAITRRASFWSVGGCDSPPLLSIWSEWRTLASLKTGVTASSSSDDRRYNNHGSISVDLDNARVLRSGSHSRRPLKCQTSSPPFPAPPFTWRIRSGRRALRSTATRSSRTTSISARRPAGSPTSTRRPGKWRASSRASIFNDSDLYKVIEGAAYSLAHERDREARDVRRWHHRPHRRRPAAGWVSLHLLHRPQRAGQAMDQHARTCTSCTAPAISSRPPCAYYQATGKRKLLDVAIKLANHIDSVFGPDKRHDVPGHEEIELALVKLARITKRRAILQARPVLHQRARAARRARKLYGEYSQDDIPLTDARRSPATPSGRCISSPARPMSPPPPAISRRSRRWTRSGTTWSIARCTSPAASARRPRTKALPSPTTCPTTAPMPRPARPSAWSSGTTAWPCCTPMRNTPT